MDKKCNLIKDFDSCEVFRKMSIEPKTTSMSLIERYIQNGLEKRDAIGTKMKISKKDDIGRDPNSRKKMLSLKASVRIDNQVVRTTTIEPGSPLSFLNWTAAKLLKELSENEINFFQRAS